MLWCAACGTPLLVPDARCPACGRDPCGIEPPVPPGLVTPAHHLRCPRGCPGTPQDDVAGLRIAETGRIETVRGATLAGLETVGELSLFRVSGRGDVCVDLAVIGWLGGEREVRCVGGAARPARHGHDLLRRRLPVLPWGRDHLLVEVEPARGAPEGAAPARAGRAGVAGGDAALPPDAVCARCALLAAGALVVGTRQEVLGTTDPRRHVLAAAFAPRTRRVPVVAFVLAHLLPLLARRPSAPTVR